jgi:uncharacterized damage-inducible protein DinB
MTRAAAVVALALLALPAFAHADDPAQPAAAGTRTEKTDYLFVFDHGAKYLNDLAAEIPAEKYAWRPAEGVRSVGEVVQHVAGSVYYLTFALGVKPPAGHPQTMAEAGALEKAATKAEATASLARALAYARTVAENATPEQLTQPVELFGMKINGRTTFMLLSGHMQEHLGQLIAYARANGVVPPWSQAEKQGG